MPSEAAKKIPVNASRALRVDSQRSTQAKIIRENSTFARPNAAMATRLHGQSCGRASVRPTKMANEINVTATLAGLNSPKHSRTST